MKLKYRGIIIAITLGAMLLGAITFSMIPNKKNVATNGSGTVVTPGAFSYDGTATLKKNAYPEINLLIEQYFDAKKRVDMNALQGLVSNIDQINQNKLQAQLEYVENIQNIQCFTIDGPIEGSYRVYVYYELKIKNVATPAPALTGLYVTLGSNGNHIIYLGALDDQAQQFIEKSDQNSDVVDLTNRVKASLDYALSSDAQLKQFYTMLEQSLKSAGQEPVTPEAVTGAAQ